MVRSNIILKISKMHFYFECFSGIRFWFGIHMDYGSRDHLKQLSQGSTSVNNELSPFKADISEGIKSMALRTVNTVLC